MTTFKKPLSLFSLVAINVIAIDSLRTLPFSAVYGYSVIFYYLIAAITFFIPVSLVAAELATAFPETGGVYIWVREAFGKQAGLLTIWLQWFYNIVWYPTIMSVIAVTVAYLFNPALQYNKLFMLSVMMTMFWLCTWINCKGMRAASWLSDVSAIVGTMVPMLLVIALGAAWVIEGHPLQIQFTAQNCIPHFNNLNNLVLLIAVLYGLVGMEMSASHAREVANPKRDYPKAVLYSILMILFTLICGSLAISIVVPAKQLNIVSGLLQAFALFFQAFHLTWLMPIVAIFIILGAIGGAAAWMLGPSKGMLMACRDGLLPKSLGVVSFNHTPVRILILQGVIFTLLCSVFVLMPTVSSGFWVLTDVTAILALLVYVLMFPAAIVLRYKFPHREGTYQIPGGKVGLWSVCLLGMLTCLFGVFIGFVPPKQIPVGNLFTYEGIIAIGVVLGCLVPFGLAWVSKRLN